MNCNEAFDCLTDPVRRHSGDLTRHLSHCPRCRQMKEVLSPAIDLLVSTSAGDASEFGAPPRGLDEGGLDLEQTTPRPATISADAILLAERTAAELSRPSRGPRRLRRRFGTFARFAAILLLGAVMTLSVTTWANRNSDDRRANSAKEPNDKCLWVHHSPQSRTAKNRSSRQVVLSCVECHLGQSFD